MSKVTVIGIGAMGGGMARQLRDSGYNVEAFDTNVELLKGFYGDDVKLPETLSDVIHSDTKAIFVVLLNERQCETVCFDSDESIQGQAPPGCLIFVCSTVTANWVKSANARLPDLILVDCPTSGGPVRAREGELTLMVSFADTAHEVLAEPYLKVLGKSVHKIDGGIGMGSTVKAVHQLLAGVHICVAAEAMSLAAKAGLDVQQLYDVVNGAAGASWMFQDRGVRMMRDDPDQVKSQLDIFVKDLDIVYQEAKRLQAPIPIASAALQQFVSGQALGLGTRDDSQVVRVYEKITGVKVQANCAETRHGDEIGDVWVLEDGSKETILEVGDEPRHKVVLKNDFVRAIRVSFPSNDTTVAHRHAEDSLYFFLVQDGLDVINHVKGQNPACDCMGFGEVRYGTHKTEKPLVHRITNRSNHTMLCIDAEILSPPPIAAAIPLVAEKHELIKTRDKCRVYKLTLQPGESCSVDYPFFYLSVIVEASSIMVERDSRLRWEETRQRGDVAWSEPTLNIQKTNKGTIPYVEYIAEWRK